MTLRGTVSLLLVWALTGPAGADWPMAGHDVRRTGRATVDGPRSPRVAWRHVATGGVVINMEPTVTRDGVYFGTWGLLRRHGRRKAAWDKFDGRIIGLRRDTGAPRWPALHPGHTPYGYPYAGRPTDARSKALGAGVHLNWYNGTVEGTPAVDPKTGVLYVGRGDGTLYAVDPGAGRLRWRYRTRDPARPADPEGGGEIVGGPLVTPGGLIAFATFAAPHRPTKGVTKVETNAVYAVSRAGQLVWRYPRQGSLTSPFTAPVALSPDGKTLYAVTALPDADFPCELLALDAARGRLRWRTDLGGTGGHDLAVGVDGNLYLGGMVRDGRRSYPAAFSVSPAGTLRWGPIAVEGTRARSHWIGGVALVERGGRVTDVYASTTLTRGLNGAGGQLHRLDPRTGQVTASWDPATVSPPCTGGLTDVSIDRSGVLYVGVRGRPKTLLAAEQRGRMVALRRKGAAFEIVWSHGVDGQLDWASPAIGPDGGLYFGSSDRLHGIGFGLLSYPPGQVVKQANPVFTAIKD